MRTEGRFAGLYYTLFEPNQPAKATLLLLHGMEEHQLQYAGFAQYLTAQADAVLAYDQLGHSYTAGTELSHGLLVMRPVGT